MYCLIPEKPLRLVYENFYLAIGDTFYDAIKVVCRGRKYPDIIRTGYQTATILRQSTIWIQIPDTGRIVNKAFFSKLSEMLEFWA
jgi:hypothetical protein